MQPEKISFAWLDKRLRAIPDGPAEYLNTPSWVVVWNVIGLAGVVIGLSPVLLRQFMPVGPGVVWVALTGLILEVVGFFPYFFYSTLAIVRSFLRRRAEFVQQLDHDIAQLRGLSSELAQYPTDTLNEHLRFTRNARSRLAMKFAFLFGGIDRLGILPVAIAVALQIKLIEDISAVPGWLLFLAAAFAILYFVALFVSHDQIRLQLFEIVLVAALEDQPKSSRSV
ncbi:hypothetical protein [Arenimonas sp.]|uniref:hypothetical protein n=1 Tax=Arenimonas sp. TaxID=1872635 RepID=UPI0039E51E8A